MKISIENYDEKITVEMPNDSSPKEVVDNFYRLMVASGFHADNVKEAMAEYGE